MNLSLHNYIARVRISAQNRATMLFLNECRSSFAIGSALINFRAIFSFTLHTKRHLRQFYWIKRVITYIFNIFVHCSLITLTLILTMGK